MNKKTIRKINGGIAMYYGVTGAIGAVSGLVGTGVWLFKVSTGQMNFSWGTLAGLIIVTAIMGGMAYAIFRVGHEEFEK